MNILVVGAGAVGCKYASHFQHSGNTVSLVCRSNYKVVKANGVKLETPDGNSHVFYPDYVYCDTSEAAGSYDHVVVTTKAIPNINVVELIKPIVSTNTMIHLIQNGIGIEDDVSKQYPNNPIVSCIAYIACHQKELGTVLVTSKVTYFTAGLFEMDTIANEKLQSFIDCGVSGGLDIFRDDCIQRARWWKLIWNGSFNPLSIVAGNKNCKEMLADPHLHSLVRTLMNEVITVANLVCTEKIPLKAVDEHIAYTEKLGEYKPSMLLDWENGNPIEIKTILENPIALANKHGLDMPNFKFIYRLLQAKVNERNTKGVVQR
ncbi:hypothetical protein HK103_001711 [Boothiomyces macroporosus]|uniref:2-dehydropantoate 2-reductase n=1 Tax=Boothiomyces macroporosus TaxID=261099 RepID=A0AAD5UJK3_9FUNG|nr:hypothetical protein HK103_001711 [Boothiomyces macroporosus]